MTDLFQPDNTPAQEPANFLTELVGEGKKFKDPEALAKGKFYADEQVKTLESELAQLRQDHLKLREEYTAGRSLQEIVDHMTSQMQQPSIRDNNRNSNEDTKQSPAFDPKQIESLVSSKIHEHESTKAQNENYNMVRAKLKEVYGSNYQEVLRNSIEDLGLTEELVNNLARQHPKALFRTLGIDGPKQTEAFQSPARSTAGFSPRPAEKRTWAYYQKLKKDNPNLYAKSHNQMVQDAAILGAEFEDGDWNREVRFN